MKRVTILMFLLFWACLVEAQYVLPHGSSGSLAPEKVKFSLQTGTSFYTSPGSYSGTTFFAAPTMGYQFTPKFRLNAGIMLMQQRFNFSSPLRLGGNQEPSVVIKNSSAVEGVAFAQGDYLLSDRLILSGSVMKSLNSNDQSRDAIWRNNFQMMSLDLNYRLSNTISVGAGVKMIQSNGVPGYYQQSWGSPLLGPMYGY